MTSLLTRCALLALLSLIHPDDPAPSSCVILPVPDSVRAVRYRVPIADSALDWMHGSVRWVDEIWFLEWKVGVRLDVETVLREDGTRVLRPVLRPFRGEIRNSHLTLGTAEFVDAPTTEIEIPLARALAIRELVRQAERVDAEAGRLAMNLLAERYLQPE